MTTIDRNRPEKPSLCIPQERYPNGPVPLVEPAQAYQFYGVGTMLPKFAYQEVYEPHHYTNLYRK